MAISSTFAQNARRDPFYQFNQFQRNAGVDMTKSPAIGGASGFLEQNQDAAYNRYLASIGIGQANTNPFAQWARRQQQQTQLAHLTAMAEDPTLTYRNYLRQLGLGSAGFNNLYQQYQRLSPGQRGENPSRFVGPIRTIADM